MYERSLYLQEVGRGRYRLCWHCYRNLFDGQTVFLNQELCEAFIPLNLAALGEWIKGAVLRLGSVQGMGLVLEVDGIPCILDSNGFAVGRCVDYRLCGVCSESNGACLSWADADRMGCQEYATQVPATCPLPTEVSGGFMVVNQGGCLGGIRPCPFSGK